jgi:hypothetical protein
MIIEEKKKKNSLAKTSVHTTDPYNRRIMKRLIFQDFLYKHRQIQEYKRAVKDRVDWWEELKIPKTVKVHHKYTCRHQPITK